MSGQVTRIDAKELKAWLHDGGEIALLDAREELPFGRRHLLMGPMVRGCVAIHPPANRRRSRND